MLKTDRVAQLAARLCELTANVGTSISLGVREYVTKSHTSTGDHTDAV